MFAVLDISFCIDGVFVLWGRGSGGQWLVVRNHDCFFVVDLTFNWLFVKLSD